MYSRKHKGQQKSVLVQCFDSRMYLCQQLKRFVIIICTPLREDSCGWSVIRLASCYQACRYSAKRSVIERSKHALCLARLQLQRGKLANKPTALLCSGANVNKPSAGHCEEWGTGRDAADSPALRGDDSSTVP